MFGVLIVLEMGNICLSQGYWQVIQLQQVEIVINELFVELVNVEVGQCGFLFMGKDEYFDLYNKVILYIYVLMVEICDYYVNDLDVFKLFLEIVFQVSCKFIEMEFMLIYGKCDFEVVFDFVCIDFGKVLMEVVWQGLDWFCQCEIVIVVCSFEYVECDLVLLCYGIVFIMVVNIILLVVLGLQYVKCFVLIECECDMVEEESQKFDCMVCECIW